METGFRYGVDGWPYEVGLSAAAGAFGVAAAVAARRRSGRTVPIALAVL